MNQQLAIRNNTTPSAAEFQIMLQQSEMLVKTGFLPKAIENKEQALAIILTGRELGIPTMAALNTINVIQGKPTISPQLMLALIERSGQLADIQYKTTSDGVSCTMKRKGRSEHTETFGTKEATALGLMTKDNYKKQAQTMFKWRVTAACARLVFPDVILGLYTPDEMGAEISPDGEILNGKQDLQRAEYEVYHEEKALTVEPEVDERKEYENNVLDLCSQLNTANDSIKWKPASLKEYINEMFEVSDGMNALTFDTFEILLVDLEGRLKYLE